MCYIKLYCVVIVLKLLPTVIHFLYKHLQADRASRKGGEGGDTSIYGPYGFIT